MRNLSLQLTQMAQCTIDIKVGIDGTQQKQKYKHIDLHLELHQQKLLKINQELCSALSKTTTPFVVIEYPNTQLQGLQIFKFKEKEYDSAWHLHHGKLFQFANPKNKETIKLVKNTEKQMQKITRLNNNCSLRVSLYQQEEEKHGLSLLNRSKFKGHVQTDQQLVGTLTQIIRRISNQFLNSPIMAILQLFEHLTLKVQLEKIQSFPQELKQSLLKMLDVSEWVKKETLLKLASTKGEITIHITLPKLFSLKIKAQIAHLTSFLFNFS